jgi:hypothetical protein
MGNGEQVIVIHCMWDSQNAEYSKKVIEIIEMATFTCEPLMFSPDKIKGNAVNNNKSFTLPH